MTFYAVNTTSDLSPSWPNTTEFNFNTNTSVVVGASKIIDLIESQIKSGGLINISTLPNNDNWESGGTWTVNYNIGTANSNIRGRVRAVMLNSSGTILQSGSFTGYTTFSSTGAGSFSVTAPTWSASQACSNRMAIEYEFENTNIMMGTESLTITLGGAAIPISTDLSINTASCTTTFLPKVIIY